MPFIITQEAGDKFNNMNYPHTLVITDLSETRTPWEPTDSNNVTVVLDAEKKYQYTSNAPNRVPNRYINLKEKVKELMFLPTDFKKQLIDYFETWAIDDAVGDEKKDRWCAILDPLNFDPKDGILLGKGGVTWTNWKQSNSNLTQFQFGLDGFIKKSWTKAITSGEGIAEGADGSFGGGWFSGKDKGTNLWYLSYAGDSQYNSTRGPSADDTAIKSSESSSDYDTTCFVKGTKVSMANGGYKNIENIIEGDEVLSYNTITNEFGVDTVLTLPEILGNYQKIIAIYEDGTKNEFSPAHPFYIEGKGWASYDLTDKLIISKIEGAPTWSSMFKEGNLHQLEVGDYCINNKGEKLKITSLDETDEYVDMYNLEHLSNNKNWFANGTLVKE
jgi:hypothetical protein